MWWRLCLLGDEDLSRGTSSGSSTRAFMSFPRRSKYSTLSLLLPLSLNLKTSPGGAVSPAPAPLSMPLDAPALVGPALCSGPPSWSVWSDELGPGSARGCGGAWPSPRLRWWCPCPSRWRGCLSRCGRSRRLTSGAAPASSCALCIGTASAMGRSRVATSRAPRWTSLASDAPLSRCESIARRIRNARRKRPPGRSGMGAIYGG